MAFFVGGALVGIVVVYDDHSNYSDYRDHSRHSKYSDSALVSQINNKQSQVTSQAQEIDRFREQMHDDYNYRIRQLQNKKNYNNLRFSQSKVVDKVKEEMRQELDAEIASETEELRRIDEMIKNINEMALKAGG